MVMSSQSRAESFVEASMNTGIGFVVSATIWPAVAMMYGLPYSLSVNLGITSIFTVTSLLRSYIVRRFFATNLHRVAVRLAGRITRCL